MSVKSLYELLFKFDWGILKQIQHGSISFHSYRTECEAPERATVLTGLRESWAF
jgi:hypothetical protein